MDKKRKGAVFGAFFLGAALMLSSCEGNKAAEEYTEVPATAHIHETVSAAAEKTRGEALGFAYYIKNRSVS